MQERKLARERAFQLAWLQDSSTVHRRGPAKSAVTAALLHRGCDAALKATIQVASIQMLEPGRDRLDPIIRCLVGNPFRRVEIDPSWRSWNHGAVVNIAQAIYANRDLTLMPILADALEEADCESEEILAHCRTNEVHSRGCWVVDRILGKE